MWRDTRVGAYHGCAHLAVPYSRLISLAKSFSNMTLPQYPFKLLSETCAAVDLALKTTNPGVGQRKRARSRSVLTEIGAPLEMLFNKEIASLEKKFSFLRHHMEGNPQTNIDEYLRTKPFNGKFGVATGHNHALKKKKKKLSNDATKILQVKVDLIQVGKRSDFCVLSQIDLAS